MSENDDGCPDPNPMPAPSARPWRHPSELSHAGPPLAAPSHGQSEVGVRQFAVWPTALVAGCFIASATAFVLASTSTVSPNRNELALRTTTTGFVTSVVDLTRTLHTSDAANASQPLASEATEATPAAGSDERVWALYAATGTRLGSASLLAAESANLLVTSLDAVADSTRFTAISPDGSRAVQLVAGDTLTDLAVLQIEPSDQDQRENEEQTQVQTGTQAQSQTPEAPADLALAPSPEPVMASDAVGTSECVRMASSERGCGRLLSTGESVVGTDGTTLFNLLKTSIPADPANVGGLLFDEEREPIGVIVSAKSSLTFAAHLDEATEIASALSAEGAVGGPWLGIEVETNADGSVAISDVSASGPSHLVLQVGDVIEQIDQTPILNSDHLAHMVRHLSGDPVDVALDRDGAKVIRSVTPGRR